MSLFLLQYSEEYQVVWALRPCFVKFALKFISWMDMILKVSCSLPEYKLPKGKDHLMILSSDVFLCGTPSLVSLQQNFWLTNSYV